MGLSRLFKWKQLFSRDTLAMLLAWRDPRLPRSSKLLLLGMLAYVVSPIDLLPDMVPLAGLIDDLILVPMGLSWLRSGFPEQILADYRRRSQRTIWTVLAAVVGLVVLVVVLIYVTIWMNRP
jgi:uncharacterized membrane protein YkvA (DUF1232 family)